MLNIISTFIGGNVRETGSFVIWVENFQRKIFNIIKIFEKYPPLTKRLRSQIVFMNSCLNSNNVNVYLNDRPNKYRNDIAEISPDQILGLSYFCGWLSGFIEAEGCFCLRSNSSKVRSFSISQKNEKNILLSIKMYLNSESNIRLLRNKNYFFETCNKLSLSKITSHCNTYPLIGEKQKSFFIFSNY